MSNSVLTPIPPTLGHPFTILTTRLTIGSAVCFSEGIFASIMIMVSKDIQFFYASTLLTLIIWAAFWCFRETKLGADIGDLCFYEFVLRCLDFIFYVYGIDPTSLWYPFAAISVLKLIRVYLYQTSETQQKGWGKFGPMTWFHSKYYGLCKPIAFGSRLEKEVLVSLIVAAVASAIIRLLPDAGRVAVTWIVPLSFEFLYGPMQLRNLKVFNNLLSASTEREADKDAEILRLKQENERLQNEVIGLREIMLAPKKAHTDLIDAYEITIPERQGQLVKIVQGIANTFSRKKPG